MIKKKLNHGRSAPSLLKSLGGSMSKAGALLISSHTVRTSRCSDLNIEITVANNIVSQVSGLGSGQGLGAMRCC